MARELPLAAQRLADANAVPLPIGPRPPEPQFDRRDVLVRQTAVDGLENLTPFEIDAEAWRLSTLGWSPWRITAALGLTEPGALREALDRYMDSEALTERQKIGVMVGQLDQAIEQVIGVSFRTHYRFTGKGEMITMLSDPSNPDSDRVPVVDDKPILDAARVLTPLLERKAALLGLDKPTKHEHKMIPLPAPAARWIESKRLDQGA